MSVRLAVINTKGQRWSASYRTASGFRYVDLGSCLGREDAERRADEIESRT